MHALVSSATLASLGESRTGLWSSGSSTSANICKSAAVHETSVRTLLEVEEKEAWIQVGVAEVRQPLTAVRIGDILDQQLMLENTR